MTLYEVLTVGLDALILLFIMLEYFYGRPDIRVRNEANRKRDSNKNREKSIMYDKEMD